MKWEKNIIKSLISIIIIESWEIKNLKLNNKIVQTKATFLFPFLFPFLFLTTHSHNS